MFTNADGFGLVPAWLAVFSHDASQGWVSLQRVAAVAVVGDGGAQLELHAHPRPIAYHTGLEAGLPGVLCRKRQRSETSGTVEGQCDTCNKGTLCIKLWLFWALTDSLAVIPCSGKKNPLTVTFPSRPSYSRFFSEAAGIFAWLQETAG